MYRIPKITISLLDDMLGDLGSLIIGGSNACFLLTMGASYQV
jgi:hypothetical protein